MSSFCSRQYFVKAVAASPTDKVFVIIIGVSMLPSSLSWTMPRLFPKPLSTDAPATSFDLKIFPS